jgi:hypothetical protein
MAVVLFIAVLEVDLDIIAIEEIIGHPTWRTVNGFTVRLAVRTVVLTTLNH